MNLNDSYTAFVANPADPLCFEELKRELGKLCRAAMHDIFNYQERRDLAEDAVAHILANLHKYNGDSLFSTWAFAVARNCAKMELRRMHRERNIPDMETLGEPSYKELADDLPQWIVKQLSTKELTLLKAMLANNNSTVKVAEALCVSQRHIQRQWKLLKTKLLALLVN